MRHKETKEETLQRVKDKFAKEYDYDSFELYLEDFDIKEENIDEIAEAYRIERNKQEAPDERMIESSYPLNCAVGLIDQRIYIEGAKWAINHFTNLNK